MKGTPTSEAATRVAHLFRRRLNTPWAKKEIRQFRLLKKSHCFDSLADLTLIEQYYFSERKKGDKGIHRRDLYTFLNNFQGELDRATAWREEHPLKPPPRKIIPMPSAPSEPFIQTPEAQARTDKFMEQYRQHKATSAFQKAKKIMQGDS